MEQLVRIATLVLILATGAALSSISRAEALPFHTTQVSTDLNDVFVRFKVKILGFARIMGQFDRLSGKLISDADGQGTGVRMHIDVDSVNTNHPERDDYLRGPGFFASKQHPHIIFSGSCLYRQKDGSRQIVGDLSLRGVTRRIIFEVQPIRSAELQGIRGYQATAVIRRSEFGLTNLKHIVSDEVEIIVAMNAGA